MAACIDIKSGEDVYKIEIRGTDDMNGIVNAITSLATLALKTDAKMLELFNECNDKIKQLNDKVDDLGKQIQELKKD